jgi:hypothetical protein
MKPSRLAVDVPPGEGAVMVTDAQLGFCFFKATSDCTNALFGTSEPDLRS